MLQPHWTPAYCLERTIWWIGDRLEVKTQEERESSVAAILMYIGIYLEAVSR